MSIDRTIRCMAFIRSLEPVSRSSGSEHTEVDAGYQVRHSASHGNVVQIDTYGSDERKLLAKSSQSIQLDRDGAAPLVAVRLEVFPDLPRD